MVCEYGSSYDACDLKASTFGHRGYTVTIETAWVSGFLGDVTVMTVVTVIYGYVLSRGQRSSMSSKASTG